MLKIVYDVHLELQYDISKVLMLKFVNNYIKNNKLYWYF